MATRQELFPKPVYGNLLLAATPKSGISGHYSLTPFAGLVMRIVAVDILWLFGITQIVWDNQAGHHSRSELFTRF